MSGVPEILDALVALARLHLPEGVVIYDGPPDVPPEQLPDRFFVIGWDPAGERAVNTEITGGSLAAGDVKETSSIACGASVAAGETTVKAVRDEAVGLYTTFRTALAHDQRLGGLVLRAVPRFAGLDPVQTEKGAIVDVFFFIDVLAFER